MATTKDPVDNYSERLEQVPVDPVGPQLLLGLSGRVGNLVDTSKYSVHVNACTVIISLRRKPSEKTRYLSNHVAAQQKVETFGKKRIRARKNSSLSARKPKACIQRASSWRAWHSAWIYDVRPPF